MIRSFPTGVESEIGPEEEGDHEVLETVALHLGPVLYLVGRDVLSVAGNVVGGEGVGSGCSDNGHKLVIFVRDGYLGSQVTQGIYPVIDLCALVRIGGAFVHVEEFLYLVKVDFL